MGKVLFSQVSVCSQGVGEGGGYLPWMGVTYLGRGVPTLDGGRHLPWIGMVPTLGGGVVPGITPPPTQQAGWGTPLPIGLDRGTPWRQRSRASTCYAVGGMPLAFTQEDFLVYFKLYPFRTLLSSDCIRTLFS